MTSSKIPGQLVWLWLSAVVIVLDQITKHMIVDRFSLYERLDVFPHFNLTLAYNSGAAFSFLADAGGWQRWLFTAIGRVSNIKGREVVIAPVEVQEIHHMSQHQAVVEVTQRTAKNQ